MLAMIPAIITVSSSAVRGRRGESSSINNSPTLLLLCSDICLYIEKGNYYQIDEYKPKDTRLEIGLICKKKNPNIKKPPKNYYFKKFPKTKALIFTFKGPYYFISLIHKRLDEYYETKIGYPK